MFSISMQSIVESHLKANSYYKLTTLKVRMMIVWADGMERSLVHSRNTQIRKSNSVSVAVGEHS